MSQVLWPPRKPRGNTGGIDDQFLRFPLRHRESSRERIRYERKMGLESHPVTANRANPRTRRGVKVWKGWLVGTNGNPVRGPDARLPDGTLVDISVAIQKEYNAEQEIRRGENKITAEQIYLWRRMDRPPGAPFRNFIEDRARYGDPSLGQ